MLHLFDTQLHAALTAVLLLTAAPAAGPQQGGQRQSLSGSLQLTTSNASSISRAASGFPGSSAGPGPAAAGAGAGAASPAAAAAVAAAGKQRAAELETYAQQHCLQEVQQLASRLQQQMQQLPAADPGVRGAPVVEQVLLLARLCSALAAQSCMLPAVLGPADAWPAAAAAGPLAGPPGSGSGGAGGAQGSGLPASLAQGVSALGPAAAALLRMHHPGLAGPVQGGAPSGTAALLVSLQQQLHGIACGGYAAWAGWAGTSFAAEVSAALAADELLYSDTTPVAWTETKLAADATGAAGADAAGLLDMLDYAAAAAGDMSFALPACPSGAMLQAVSRACWVSESGGSCTSKVARLKCLQHAVSTAAAPAKGVDDPPFALTAAV